MHRPSVRAAIAALFIFLLAGCGGGSSEESPPDDTGSTSNADVDAGDTTGGADTGATMVAEYPSEFEPGPTAMRRLTGPQFENSVHDLLGGGIVVPPLAEPDLPIGGLISIGASASSLGARGVESLESAAYAVAEQAMDTAERRAALVPCEPSGTVDSACAQAFVESFGRLAWRRPLEADEVTTIVEVADRAATELGDFYDGLEFAVAAILQSPHFLFRLELGEEDPDNPGQRRFTDLELASRLSFFLWNTTPDAELLQAAEDGELSTQEGLAAQAERLLESPRARLAVRNFFSEHLELYELDHLSKDPTLFEHYSSDLGPDAREETLSLMEHVVFDAEMDYRDVMTTRETFLNQRLAALYGVPAPTREGFGLARLPASGGRAGLLGHASLLSLHSHPVSSSATLRGVAVRTILLCQEIPAPPVNVDTSIPEPSGDTLTLRDRVAEHLTNRDCAGCHILTDPIGLGLENFDGVGRWRDTDNGALIDPSGELDREPFEDPIELGKVIREHPDFAPCLVKTLTRYAIGRLEADGEEEVMEVMAERFAATHDYRVKPLMIEIITSPMFRVTGELN